MDRTVALAPTWDSIWARRRPILTLVLIVTTVVGIVVFLLPPWYRAEAVLLPAAEEDTGIGLTSLMRGVSVPGIKIPTQVSAADVFLAVLESRRVNEEIVRRFDLKSRYRTKLTVDAISKLQTHTAFELTDAGTIKVAVEDRDPRRAADMANAYVELLDQFNRQVRMTKGRRTRIFVEKRLAETREELVTAEQRLADYQSKHRAIAISPGMSSAVEESAKLYARRTMLEVRLGVVRNYSLNSEEETQISQELIQLDRQMKTLPGIGIELARHMRDAKALEQVFVFLTAQYEDARISEARDLVTVEILDQASPPERRIRPRRGLTIAAAFLTSLVVGCALVLLQRGSGRPGSAVPTAAGE